MNSILNLSLMFIFLTLSGTFSAFSSNIRTLLINDAVELEKNKNSVDVSAVFFSFVTALIKINSGISSLAASFGYTLIGFTSAQTAKLNLHISQGVIPRESNEYTPLFTMLFFMFSILPAVSAVLSILPFCKKGKKILKPILRKK